MKADTIVECDETEANDEADGLTSLLSPPAISLPIRGHFSGHAIPLDQSEAVSPESISAKLRTEGVCVSYKVPAPPIIHPQLDSEEEFDKFLTKVRGSPPDMGGDSLKRSDTSSATLPVTWSSSSLDKRSSESSFSSIDKKSSESSSTCHQLSRDALLSSESGSSPVFSGSQGSLLVHSPPLVQGPVILHAEDFEPQVMTDDCPVLCPREYSSPSTSHSSTTSGSMFYATFIPDRCLQRDEVSIVCNEFTQIETDSHDSSSAEEEKIPAAKEPAHICEKNWTSTLRLPSLLDFWERRNQESKFKKYASESNICGQEAPLENGLRKIARDKNFTSCEESLNEESDYSVRSGYEDHIYEEVSPLSQPIRGQYPAHLITLNQSGRPKANNEESGFFSYENPSLYRPDGHRVEEEISNDDNPEDSVEHLDSSFSKENNVTIIAVDYNSTNNNTTSCPDKNNQTVKALTSVKDLRKLFERDETAQVRFKFSCYLVFSIQFQQKS